MAMTSTGANLAMVDNGAGKLTIAWGPDGNPIFNDDQQEAVFSLLMEPSGWFADTGNKRRTKIPTVKTVQTGTAGRLQEYSRDALQPLIDDGRLQSVSPVATTVGRGYNVKVDYVTGGGNKSSVTVPLSV